MKVFDLFCGTGGFSKGLENSEKGNFEVVFGIDLLPSSVETFKLNHTNATGFTGDIRAISRRQVEEITKVRPGQLDVIVGGPPCQGFSSVRPFRSSTEDDPRNSLFEEYASFVNYFRPKAFVLENVIGLITYKGGSTLQIMQECFHSLGYDTDWRVVNAAHFGVPQRRERFILIGVQRGAKILFPEPSHSYSGNGIGCKDKSRLLSPQRPLPPAITVMEAIGDLPPIKAGESSCQYGTEPTNPYQRDRRGDISVLSMHKATVHSEDTLERVRHSGDNINCLPPHLAKNWFSNCYSRLNGDEPSTTLTVNFVYAASSRCIHPTQDRALTPREGARLQSFDDDFKFYGGRTQVNKQIGNAVPPLLGKAIGDALSNIL